MKSENCKSIGFDCQCRSRAAGSGKDMSTYDETEKEVTQLIEIIRELPDTDELKDQLIRAVKILKGDWFIDSIDHNYCFWQYMQYAGCKKHTLQECANLLGISISAVSNIEKKALEKVKAQRDMQEMNEPE